MEVKSLKMHSWKEEMEWKERKKGDMLFVESRN